MLRLWLRLRRLVLLRLLLHLLLHLLLELLPLSFCLFDFLLDLCATVLEPVLSVVSMGTRLDPDAMSGNLH